MKNDKYPHLTGFDNIVKVLHKEIMENKQSAYANTYNVICMHVFAVGPSEIVRHDYVADGVKWFVWESPRWKIVGNENFDYNYFFSKINGFTCRFGKELSDDPVYCPLGPEIADIEIGAGACPKINGKNCAFCYKSNGGSVSYNMKLDEFKKLVDFMPKNLSQIAFGITGVYSNPDFFDIMSYAKSIGISPNYTTNGVDLDEAAIDKTLDLCGRIAVSCYEGAKEICYNTLKQVGERAKTLNKKFPCNIHIVLSKDTYGHVMDVLNDAKEGKIENLGAVVILRIKPVGRAKNLDCNIPAEMYDEIVRFCIDNNIKFGFDSCGAKQVEKVLHNIGRDDLINCVEACEAGKLSSYFSYKGLYSSCSFCENLDNIPHNLDPFKYATFTKFWNSDDIKILRFPKNCKCESCPYYNLD
jgi:hypothetical protein